MYLFGVRWSKAVLWMTTVRETFDLLVSADTYARPLCQYSRVLLHQKENRPIIFVLVVKLIGHTFRYQYNYLFL